ncbi:MAG: FAD-dependent oxidoreductase [Caldilineaceae bacterium]|uniref:NAD(P)/FAD-dependent oxidoreductase n=1 Tax=Caldilineaceae bacterium SB0675_bin_29 TaxID=2605266 RepID=A0A6B1FYV9_9CHLR|nr:FAD-dependent oxidoreductase [Caldilineaceae bacterium]MYH62752.1 NAD(P)/FAD-dependent oxidoreductase [Caldilineaceae bacterium SB0675_bin_29]
MQKQIVVIGGGPAGVEAAATAAPYAAAVTIVSERPIGAWHQLLPSRVWLTAIDNLYASQGPPASATKRLPDMSRYSLSEVHAHADRIGRQWSAQQARKLQDLGVKFIEGKASFQSPSQLLIASEADDAITVAADAFIVAAGSTPFVPPTLAPDGRRVFSPATAHKMPHLPASMIVIGDGPTGFEFVHIFSALNIDVTWLVLPGGPSCAIAPDADPFLIDMLLRRGVQIRPGEPVAELKHYEDHVAAVKPDGLRHKAEMAFVTIGNRPNVAPLNLEAAGVHVDARGSVRTDGYGQTNVAGIYAAGDARQVRAGSVSMAHARVAALHATGQETEPYDESCMVIPFLSNPQVAQVGVLSATDDSIRSVQVAMQSALKTHISGHTQGFLRLAWNRDRQVVGGLAVGYQAADALAPVAVAIKTKTTIDTLASLYGPHPSISELPFMAARAACRQAL